MRKVLLTERSWTELFPVMLIISVGLYQIGTVAADPDLWGYLAFGRLFWNSAQFPLRDVFSYVPTLYPWVYHEWLTGVLFYPIYVKFGGEGLQLLKYVLGLTTFGLIYLTARNRGNSPLGCAIGVCLVIRGWAYSPVRAQVFTCLFFALTLYLVDTARLRQNGRRLWFVVFIMVLWCNLHGGFLMGLGLIGLYCIGALISRHRFSQYAGILLLSGLVTLINPYGLNYWSFLVRAISMPRPEIYEWASIQKAFQLGYVSRTEIVNLAAMILLGLFLMMRTRWKDITAGLALSVTLVLGLLHIRHLVFYYLLMGAFLPSLFTYYIQEMQFNPKFIKMSNRASKTCLLFVVTLISAWAFVGFIQKFPLRLEIISKPDLVGRTTQLYYPVGAVTYIQQRRLSGNILTEFGWGEYLIWKLYPACKIALDGRYETVYPDEVTRSYFEFFKAGQSCQFVRDYPPDMILLAIRPKVYEMIKSGNKWQEIYSDAGSVLFIRGDKQFATRHLTDRVVSSRSPYINHRSGGKADGAMNKYSRVPAGKENSSLGN